jgi:hypothetical protein
VGHTVLAVPRFGSDPPAETRANRLSGAARRRQASGMFYDHIEELDTYMADLDEEIEATLLFYVGFAVTEIATLRAEMSAPQTG